MDLLTQSVDMTFSKSLIAWQRQHGRHGLPWQQNRDPYYVWLSEIMLQQTQVSSVIPYYLKFLNAFPTVMALAKAPQQEVMALWAGLGYYARARNLHRCAQTIVDQFNGQFPARSDLLASLPGIGPSTAAAIAAFCFSERVSILDGNVKRVLARYRAIHGDPGKKDVERQLWQVATDLLPSPSMLKKDPDAMASHTQGLMDLGALVCTRGVPKCDACPVQPSCHAHANALVSVLPTPRARKAIPERSTMMLIIEHHGHILLEQRPPKGVWGGLWSLPEMAEECLPLAQQDGSITLSDQDNEATTRATITKLAAFQHVFTHFKLHIQPFAIRVSGQARPMLREITGKGVMRWVPFSEIDTYGLPKPVKTLLQGWLKIKHPDGDAIC